MRKRYFSVDLSSIQPFFKPAFHKHDSDNKLGSSTLDSEPKIEDEPSKDSYAEFKAYMESKDLSVQQCRRRCSTGNILTVPILLHPWKLYPPSFFAGQIPEQKEEDSDSGEKDYEYLSNPEHIQVTPEQQKFLEKFYPEYANKDPISVLQWLHMKSSAYHESKQ